MGKKDAERRAVSAAAGLFQADCPLRLNDIEMFSLGYIGLIAGTGMPRVIIG